MLHAFPRTIQLPVQHGSCAGAEVAPMVPATYLRLRREAAGLTIGQVAGKIGRSQDRDVVVAMLVLLETPGSVARHRLTLDYIGCAFPFDPDVYRQIAEDPADRHPRICRGCGCSEYDPCVSAEGHEACGWATDVACTYCEAKASRR